MTWWGRYVGLPFDAAHCWALVRRVYADQLGIELPEYGEVDAGELVAVARSMARGKEAWALVSDPRPFDVALMRGRSAVWHVGVMTDRAHVLHTERATGAVRVPITAPSVRGRIMEYRRYA